MREIYKFWRKKRLVRGASLTRRFWRKYEFTAEDNHAIFRDRYEDKSMKLRKKHKTETDSYYKVRGLCSNLLSALGLCYEVVRREKRKLASDMYQRVQFEKDLLKFEQEYASSLTEQFGEADDLILETQEKLNQECYRYIDFYEKEIKTEQYPEIIGIYRTLIDEEPRFLEIETSFSDNYTRSSYSAKNKFDPDRYEKDR